jgi:hypothetical protein
MNDITRRGLLGEAGGVAAGGLLVLGLPDSADAARRRGRAEVGAGRTDRHTVGILSQIQQVGTALTAFGYVTRARGLSNSTLFTRPPGKTTNDPRSADPSAARITFLSKTTISNMDTVGSVITAVLSGGVRFFHQADGGARFADPGSFARGEEIAAFAGTFQNNLAVDAPDSAGVALSADLAQRSGKAFRIGGRAVRFGHKGLAWSLEASGRGERTERSTPRAVLFVSGELGVVDAASRR